MPSCVFLDLLACYLGHAPIRNSGSENGDVGREVHARLACQHFVGACHRNHAAHRAEWAVTPGPITRTLPGPELHRRFGNGIALLAGGMIGDVAHRINRLARRARRDQHMLALAAACAREQAALQWPQQSSAGSAMRPGPNSPQAISPSVGPDKENAIGHQLYGYCAGSPHAATSAHSWRVRPAPACRWREASWRQDHWQGHVAILARRSAVAGATTTRSAERDSSIWPISISSVRLKRSRMNLAAGEAGNRQGRDELLRRLGHDGGRRHARCSSAAGSIPATCRRQCRHQ